MSRQPSYWFPAKRYGWGWGVPTTWQGWTVLLGYAGVMAASAALLLPQQRNAFLVCTALWTVLLVAICWWKGEPPRWRTGK
ncbi:hypothetical protein SAMN05216570_3337 [Dyella sp. OK004]|uniref:hypothetical protein n=1 Tax=Dyella sp. OK004 TaxID=1855292 RepID=UPI0008EC530B|nr:hypothetical protein [Dyella sp. OK004]SFS16578.1 hypothetical protein SAMN05216570_3337 [Dyella sp. OK004]